MLDHDRAIYPHHDQLIHWTYMIVYIHWGGESKVPCPRPQYNDPCQASNREQFIRSSASYKPYGNGIFTLHHLKDM